MTWLWSRAQPGRENNRMAGCGCDDKPKKGGKKEEKGSKKGSCG
jgi:hypothetical protein